MLSLKKFLFCIENETGALIISAYCFLTDTVYIVTLMMLFKHIRITKNAKEMNSLDRIKALSVGLGINVVIFHAIASILFAIGVRKVSQ
jgi:hypothetical protein